MLKTIKLLILILVVVSNGCLSRHEITKNDMLRAGFTQDYAEGFADGENSGYAAGGATSLYFKFMKDTYRYQLNNQYHQGWNDGFSVGKGKQEASLKLIYGG